MPRPKSSIPKRKLTLLLSEPAYLVLRVMAAEQDTTMSALVEKWVAEKAKKK